MLDEKMVDITEGNFSFAVILVRWISAFLTFKIGNVVDAAILASATDVVAISAATRAGCRITFMEIFKFGAVITMQSLIMASIYLAQVPLKIRISSDLN